MKRFVSAVLTAVLLLAFVPARARSVAASEPSGWAVAEMNDANVQGFLTPNAQKDYRRNLTRAEFCEIVVALIERTLGNELPLPATNPFTDTSNIDVQKASLYGSPNPVVNGVGGGLFAPDKNVARQEIVAMVARALSRLSSDTGRALLPTPAPAQLPFKDYSSISDYAVEPLKSLYANGVVKGDNFGNFNPLDEIKSEECVAVVLRANNTAQAILTAGLSADQLVDKTVGEMRIGFQYGDTADGVTRNLTLPRRWANSVDVTWSSSNARVINEYGTVTAGGAATDVVLTATAVYGGVTRSKQFTLRTAPYSGDELVLENAYRELDIEFLNAGDSVNSVTGRVFLPDSVLGADVVWSSDSPTEISASTGMVSLPQGSAARAVKLTAVITYNGQRRTKSFTLTLVNRQYEKLVSFHGIEFGMSLSEVQTRLGSYKTSFALSTTETWYAFHTNYSNFIAVGLQSNRVAGIYSMASGWASQLKNKSTGDVVSPSQADALAGVGATVYTDGSTTASGGGYAAFVYDETTSVATPRVLTADGAEQFIFNLINAFRYLNGRNQALTWNAKLASSARDHTASMGSYNYLSETGRDNSSFASRAQQKGYDSTLVSFGAVTGDGANPFDMLNNFVGVASKRTQILNSSLTVVGAGFGSGYNGGYSSLSTVVFGTLMGITNITYSPASIALNVGGTATVTLTITPSNRNETFTVASSNTSYLTVTNSGSSLTTLNLTGRAQGTAEVIVTGNSSGYTQRIPVNIGTVYASSLTVRNESNSIIVNGTQTSVSNAGNYILGKGNTYQFTATTSAYATNAGVTWASSNTSVATVSQNGLITGVNNGSAIITARVQRSTTSSDYISVSIYFTVVSMTLKIGSAAIPNNTVSMDITKNTSVTVTPSVSSLPTGTSTGIVYSGSSSSPSIAYVTSSSGSTVTVEGRSSGTARITVTAGITSVQSGNYITKVQGYFDITVTGQSKYPLSATVSPASLDIQPGEEKTITVTPNPTNASTKIVTTEYVGDASDYITVTVDSSTQNVIVKGKNVKDNITFNIYIQLSDGGTNIEPQKYRCSVTVNVKPVTYEIVTVPANGSQIGLELTGTNRTKTITATITPAFAPKDGLTINWSLLPEGSAPIAASISSSTGSSITLTAEALGTAILIAEISDSNGTLTTTASMIRITVTSPAVPAGGT
jgi:uncharacterized protein YkwD/uncharacterized protein YjdB